MTARRERENQWAPPRPMAPAMTPAPSPPPAQRADAARASVYRVHGPVRAQDGRQVWQVVRPDGERGFQPLMEALSAEVAQRQADELNLVLEQIERVRML